MALINGFEKSRDVMINAARKMTSDQEAVLIEKAKKCVESDYSECEML